VPRGKLRIYLGAAPGVGKTYAMLDEGWRGLNRGKDVVIGFVETHQRQRTAAQIRELPVVPRHRLTYRGQELEEMDVDAILDRAPAIVLVDELAHTNVPGSRNEKRWQDVEELLEAGIDVISTVNVQHLSSVNDVVAGITGVVQRETVPDSVVRAANQIELVDMTPEALRRRMAHGNIYPAEKMDTALGNYFRAGNLGALRELALLWMADRVDTELADYRTRHGITEPWETKERVVVALSGVPGAEHLLRRASRMAARTRGDLIGVHVRSADGLVQQLPAGLESQRKLISELGGSYAEVTGVDAAAALLAFAKAENATQLILGASGRSRWSELVGGSLINRVIRGAGAIDVHVISPETPEAALPRAPRPKRPASLPPRRRLAGWLLASVGMILLALAITPFRSNVGFPGALLFLLLGVVAVAIVGGLEPAVCAIVVAALAADFLFVPPLHSFRIADPTNIAILVVFAVVAAVVSVLFDQLTRRGLQLIRARAEAESLARLTGRSVITTELLPDLVDELRRTFALDGVGVLAPDGEGWRLAAAAGEGIPERPEDALFSAPLDEGSVLVLTGRALDAEDRRLLSAFISQLRIAQEELRLETQAAAAAELAEANTVRTAILSAVSHDLRTPLAGVKAAATSLLSDEVQWDSEEVRGFCTIIDTEVDRLTALIDNLLDMSRLQTGALPISLNEVPLAYVLEGAVDSVTSNEDRVVILVDEGIPPVLADAGFLERAVANVVLNALNWSPPGAEVLVEAGVVQDHVEVRVVDRGPGIPADRRELVFQAFQRQGDDAGSTPDGVGLGLAVARGFIEAMGGHLTVEDTPGGGATFIFALRQGGEP